MGTIHTSLQNFLVELGNAQPGKGKQYYIAYKEKIYDIRSGMRHFPYKPDVTWEFNDGSGKTIIFEIAFKEIDRAIIGEMFLASSIRGAYKLFIIRNYEDMELKNAMSVMDEKTTFKKSTELIHVSNNLQKAKDTIQQRLFESGYIWKRL